MQHLEEGTIHAWLDGQLPPVEAHAVEAHVADCRQCADAVAEARGLIAASSRILTALDGVPRDVMPKETAPVAAAAARLGAVPATELPIVSRAEARARRRWLRGPSLAAAATVIVAVGTFTLMRFGATDRRSVMADLERAPAPAKVSARVFDSASLSGSAPSASAPSASAVGASTPSAPAVGASTPNASTSIASTPPAARRPVPAPRTPTPAVAGATANDVVVDAAAGQRRAFAGAARERALRPAAVRDESTLAKAEKTEVAAAPLVAPVPRPAPDTARVQVFRGSAAVAQRSARADQRFDAAGAAPTATGTVRGRVADANNTGLAGAMVTIAGTSIGVTTDSAGAFVLSGVPSGARRIAVRRLGYAQADRSVSVAGDQTVTVDLVLVPATVALQSVVVTGAAAVRGTTRERAKVAAPTPPTEPAHPPAAEAQQPASAYGCYDLGITPGSAQTRSGFREIPRRIALDSAVAPGRTGGVWYQVRDLDARAGTASDGAWRPAGPDAVEIEWSYGSRTAQVHLAGSASAMMRGTVQEIDRATATGEGGTVVAVRRACGG